MFHYSLLACTVQGVVLTGCPAKSAGAIPGKLLEHTKDYQLRATQPKTLGVGPATWWGVPRMWGQVGIVCVLGGGQKLLSEEPLSTLFWLLLLFDKVPH